MLIPESLKQKVRDRWEEFTTDTERWNYVMYVHPNLFTVVLDNDCTWCQFKDDEGDEDGDIEFFHFDEFLGWSEGVFTLLHVLNIDAEGC